MEKIIGILGGMGPAAAVELLRRIIALTPAQCDQDHIRVIMDNNTKMSDRTSAILGNGPSPLAEMIRTAENLEKAGANLIMVPCNTAHYYFEELERRIHVPILNMIELTCQHIVREFPNVEKVGLIAANVVVEKNLYGKILEPVGINMIYPPASMQQEVMKAIRKLKAGKMVEAGETIREVAYHLIQEGSEIIICGCTEVSLVLHNGDVYKDVVDSLQILAEAAVAEARASPNTL